MLFGGPYINVYKWPLQHFSQNCDLAFRTTYVVSVNFMHNWRDLQFKVDSERPEISGASLPEICCEEVAKEVFKFRFVGDIRTGV